MNAIVKYSNGVTMSYSLNTFMPIEGYRLAFNGTKGRLEVRDYERQPFPVAEETEIYVMKNFGAREKIEIPKAEGGHGGGDDRLRDLIFRGVDGARPHAAARLARGRHVVPHGDRRAPQHGEGPSRPDRGPDGRLIGAARVRVYDPWQTSVV